MNIDVSSLAALAIGNAAFPKEGAKTLPLFMDFTTTGQYVLNVGDLYNQGAGYPGFSVLQTIFVDNSANEEQISINLQGSSQTIKVGPGFQGYYPILSPRIGQIVFTSSGAIVRANLINVPVPAAQWGGTNGYGDAEYTPAGYLEVSAPVIEALIANGALTVKEAD